MLRTNLSVLYIAPLLAALATAQVNTNYAPGPIEALMVTAMPKMGVSISGDFSDMTPVKGAPFCAVITTEHTQAFADGNRIHSTDSSTLCRDSEGHTWREASLNLLGAAPQQGQTTLITIVDPVAGFRYVLNKNTKTARRMALPPLSAAGGKGPGRAATSVKSNDVMFFRTAGEPGPDVVFGSVFVNNQTSAGGPEPSTENLSDQMIDGIHATGTRIPQRFPRERWAMSSRSWSHPNAGTHLS
jgi:hypothetical protein